MNGAVEAAQAAYLAAIVSHAQASDRFQAAIAEREAAQNNLCHAQDAEKTALQELRQALAASAAS